MNKNGGYLDECLRSGEFLFERLDLPDIDNQPVINANVPEIVEQETCFFHKNIEKSTDYTEILDEYLCTGMVKRLPSPVVRFADGEYAFYNFTLGCNGLYK